jgi:hypothetical protein
MTSQTYQADDDQLVQEHDQAVPEDDLMEADADLAGPEADPLAPDDDQTGNENPVSHPAGAVTPAKPESAASIASDYPDFTPGSDGAEEPGIADSGPGSPSLVSEAFTVPESGPESHPAGSTSSTQAPWNEIQAMFVDDPHASIERAAGLVDDRVEALIRSLRTRQHSVQSAWQDKDAGTEELRVALQHYRAFGNSLDDLPAQT